MNHYRLNLDAFASGQIGSKLWLCEELEKLLSPADPQVLWLLGGWYGMLPFLLKSRNRVSLKQIVNFEIDKKVEPIYKKVLDLWAWQGDNIQIVKEDCNQINFTDWGQYNSEKPTLIVNTSVEHMPNLNWWNNIPTGQRWCYNHVIWSIRNT